MAKPTRQGPERALISRPSRQRGGRRAGEFTMPAPTLDVSLHSVALRKVKDLAPRSGLTDSWQPIAYELVKKVGEAGFVTNLTANVLADGDLVAVQAGLDPDDWESTDDERVQRVLRYCVGPRGGQTEVKRRFALHQQVAGEDWLVGYYADPSKPQQSGLFWEFLSDQELHVDRQGHASRRIDGGVRVDLDPQSTYIARAWRSDAEFSDLPTSPIQGVLTILAELDVLTQMVDGMLKSRLAAGLLLVKESVTIVGEDDDPGDDGTNAAGQGLDGFTRKLLEHMSAPIEDKTSAASLVPLVARVPDGVENPIVLIELSRQLESGIAWAKDLREEALGRLASSLDIPPEILSGKSNTNHWSAFLIDTDFIVKHVMPLGKFLADFLTYAYLRPMLMEYEGMAAEEAVRFAVHFDASPLLAKVDEQATARALHRDRLISDAAWVRIAGLDPADMPEPDEMRRRFIESMILANPAMMIGLLPLLPGFEDIDVASVMASAQAGGGDSSPGAPSTSEEIPGLPGEMPTEPSPEGPLLNNLLVAADAALERAFERAGTNVKTRVGKDPTMADRMKRKGALEVLSLVTPAELRALKLSTDVLLAGAWDSFAAKARRWVRDELMRSNGHVDSLTADEHAALVVSQLCADLGDWAIAHFHTGLPLMVNGFRLPTEIVQRALDAVLTHSP